MLSGKTIIRFILTWSTSLILVLGRQIVDWCFWNWYVATLVTDLFISNDTKRDCWSIISSNFCIRIIRYIFNVRLIITFIWVKQCKILELDNVSILTYFFFALSMLLTTHTKRLNESVCNDFHLFFPQNFPMLSCLHSVSFSKMFRIFPIIFSIKLFQILIFSMILDIFPKYLCNFKKFLKILNLINLRFLLTSRTPLSQEI